MNLVASRLLTGLVAFFMLVSVAACKQYPERISYTGRSIYHSWPIEFGDIYLNGIKMSSFGNGTTMTDLPKNKGSDRLSIRVTWIEFYSRRSFEASFEVSADQLLGSITLPNLARIKITVGRHGEIIVLSFKQGTGELIEIAHFCAQRTPENDSSYIARLDYLATNTSVNDPKRLALPMPASICADPSA